MRDEELFESSAEHMKKTIKIRYICCGCGDIFYDKDDAVCHLYSDHPSLSTGSVEDQMECFNRTFTHMGS